MCRREVYLYLRLSVYIIIGWQKRKKTTKKAKKSNVSFLKDERVKKTAGVMLILASFFIGIAFASYLLTWKQDQSLIWEHPWRQVFNSSIARAKSFR
jgi:hypothetical protein